MWLRLRLFAVVVADNKVPLFCTGNSCSSAPEICETYAHQDSRKKTAQRKIQCWNAAFNDYDSNFNSRNKNWVINKN